MTPVTDVASPGGWLQLLNARVARKTVIGLLAAYGAVSAGQGVLDVYGKFQGAEADHFCESELTVAEAGTVSASCLNPLPETETGIVLLDGNSFVKTSERPLKVETTIDVGTATTATASGDNIFNNLKINKLRAILLSASGSTTSTLTSSGYIVVAPRDSSGRRFINVTFGNTSSGVTATGLPMGHIRLKVVPCSVETVDC